MLWCRVCVCFRALAVCCAGAAQLPLDGDEKELEDAASTCSSSSSSAVSMEEDGREEEAEEEEEEVDAEVNGNNSSVGGSSVRLVEEGAQYSNIEIGEVAPPGQQLSASSSIDTLSEPLLKHAPHHPLSQPTTDTAKELDVTEVIQANQVSYYLLATSHSR
jgi:hypothetical protein